MEVNFYEMYLEEMALIPVLEAEEEEKVLALAATGDKEARKLPGRRLSGKSCPDGKRIRGKRASYV